MLPDARSLPHGLAQLPEKLGRSGVAVSRAWSGLDRHDTGSTTARSVDEVALIRDTISHYAPVLIAPLSNPIRRAGVQKKFERAARIYFTFDAPKFMVSSQADSGVAICSGQNQC
jgi:hypothetical protein